jgi:hypothetical protein
MDQLLDVEHVAETLPSLEHALEDPRLRPAGIVGGTSLVAVGALLSVAPISDQWVFWTHAVASMLVFVGVPLFSLGLAAPESEEYPSFQIGVDLSRAQRRAVGAGAMCIVASPIILALGTPLGLLTPILVIAATTALVGTALVLTGFLAWTTQTLSEPTSASN